MVTRKPIASDLIPRPLSQAANNPPYPTTPPDENPPAEPSHLNKPEERKPEIASSSDIPPSNTSTLDSAKRLRADIRSDDGLSVDSDSEDEWNSDDFEEIDAEDETASTSAGIPAPLKVGGHKPAQGGVKPDEAIPATLRVGPPSGIPKTSQESLRDIPDTKVGKSISPGVDLPTKDGTLLQSHNPFLLQMQQTTPPTDPNLRAFENPSEIWSFDSFAGNNNNNDIAELPSQKTPVEQVSKLSLSNQPSDLQSPSSKQPPLIPVERENFSQPVNSGDSGGLGDRTSWEDQKELDDRVNGRNESFNTAQSSLAPQESEAIAETFSRHGGSQTKPSNPPLPPRPTPDEKLRIPPRPSVITSVSASAPEVLSPASQVKKQRKEHYQIKHIRWHDPRRGGIRPSPILVQNLNGPCPLLALVNALVLSTPPGEETALIETLRTREQVSLGLLLDAVFDELMSGRRGGAAQELPDVGELYSFLITLHTGMNVNPRFVKAAPSSNSNPWRMPEPANSVRNQPGGFEDTKEMRLYSTFSVPLIHGWLPQEDSRAHAAFDRCAKTYEDAQNVQFNEEELDAKLRSQGLTNEEQKLFEDVHTIKEFLSRWPTQLTDYGLEIISKTVQPGQIAIFFRNDHFSTLYKEPRSGNIFTLVTDAGYSSHEEIVWEKLVDVNGHSSELFSGDFRSVGHNAESSTGRAQVSSQERPVRSLLDVDDDQGWTTIEPRNRRNNAADVFAQPSGGNTSTRTAHSAPQAHTANAGPPQKSTSTAEQEDHDLALALQLQEEEEDRHRRSVEARRARENALSHQFLSAEQTRAQQRQRNANSGTNPPLIPPRRNNPSGGLAPPRTAGVTTNRPVTADSDEPPPPTYEQAASGPVFNPPSNHPASPHAPATPPATTPPPTGGPGSGARTRIAGARPPGGSAYASMASLVEPGSQGGAAGRSRRPLRSTVPGQHSAQQIPAYMQGQMGGRPGGRRHSGGGVAGAHVGGGPGADKCVVM